MISVFNIEKLNTLLKDFYNLTRIRITVFDDSFVELTSYPEQRSPVCRLIRSDKTAHEKCRQCDKTACKIASKRHTSYTYSCHAGLTESIMPIYLGNVVIGYLFFGHVMTYSSHEEAIESILNACSAYSFDKEALAALCREQPLISHDYIQSAASILQAVAAYVCLERMAVLDQKKLSAQFAEYIENHFTEPISVEFLCKYFQIGKTSLYELSNQLYGMGIAEYIRTLRIEKAKKLLIEQPTMRIAEISTQCGFHDYNYFITVFKRVVGMPPKKFTRSQKK